MTDFETEIGTEHDPVGDGIITPDASETAAEAEDQTREESPTTPSEKEEEPDFDLDQPMFAYGDQEVTGTQIVEALEAAQKLTGLESEMESLKTQLAEAQTPRQEAQDRPPDMEGGEEFAPLDYIQTGAVLERLLDGDDELGGVENIGPALADFVDRHAFNSPHFHRIVAGAVQTVMNNQNVQESFKQDFGDMSDARQSGSLDAWRKSNPSYGRATDTEAFLAMQIQDLKKQLGEGKEASEAAVKDAEAKGKKAGETETVKNLKAKGVLRPLAGNTGARQPKAPGGPDDDLKQKYDLTDPDQRSRAMAEKVLRDRQRKAG